MNFDVYYAFKNKEGRLVPGVRPKVLSWSQVLDVMGSRLVHELVDGFRGGDASLKTALPAICWNGRTVSTRKNSACKPTQLVMIDIDKYGDAQALFNKLWEEKNLKVMSKDIAIVHVTCSGKGLRIVMKAVEGLSSIEENLAWFKHQWLKDIELDYDDKVKDFSRISFLSKNTDILYMNNELLMGADLPETLKNPAFVDDSSEQSSVTKPLMLQKPSDGEGKLEMNIDVFSDAEKEKYDVFEYRGTPVKSIVDKYMEVYGPPSSGEIHNFYNELVKNFRTICSNDKRLLLYILPRFGHSADECWSQIKSICRVNTLSSIPKSFYFFLKDNGFYQPKVEQGAMREYMLSDKEEEMVKPPYLPPVFRELIGTAPNDFIMPCLTALLPVMGTLTSYVQARYPYDDRMHTTSFFSVIYAPPGTGKGFVERFMDLLFTDLKIRDFVQSERENIYLRVLQTKGSNDKAPQAPHTSLRLIPAKNSEAEFLQKQRDNHGYHMFTYAAEMDSWAKGVRAAGGNKDDMIRIAWDNGEYGQQFKSFNTFKGTVNLYWNVLITGTLQQVESYFKNVENGLVTRCSFCSIENQEFATAPKWRKLNERGLKTIKDFVKRCDENTYETPCTIDINELTTISDEEFDKEVDWRFKFRERKTVDLSWVMPVIEDFHKKQLEKAALDLDKARDVFRRRVGVRGFRLALLCTCLWKNMTKKNQEDCKRFIRWYMEKDLESILRLWGTKYNEQAETTPKLVQRTVFNELPPVFSRNDIYVVCTKQGIKTPIRRIVFEWKKLGYIEQQDKDTFKKKQ